MLPDETDTDTGSGPDAMQQWRTERGRTFGGAAEAYAAHRPDYPDAAVDWALEPLATRPAVLLDLAAGTGKLTAGLTGRADEVVAVEPDPRMLAVLRRRLPAVRALEGSAEHIPLPDGSVDGVLVGQAFHWFDPERAGAEIARVLRPGGMLAALWNAEDGSVDWVAGYHRASDDRRVPGVPQGGDRAELPRLPQLGPTERREFAHTQRHDVEGLIDVLRTHSWALLTEPNELEEIFGRVRAYFAERPELTAGPGGTFDLPLRTMVFRAVRTPVRPGELRR